MLELIYAIQAKIAAEGTSIDNILALFFGWVVLILVGYLVECHNSEKLGKGE